MQYRKYLNELTNEEIRLNMQSLRAGHICRYTRNELITEAKRREKLEKAVIQGQQKEFLFACNKN
jgi:hypothetical protein